MITLPWNLGHEIRDSINIYRRKNNIPEPDKVKALGTHNKITNFFEEELELVQELSIDKKSIKYIDLFPNIKSLTIDGLEQLDSKQFADIIEKYPNLETLRIKGQDNLKYLDVSNLSKLKKLEIISNRRLSVITGLDKIKNLEQLTFYDNIVYKKEKELCEIISKLSKRGIYCNLDVLYMPTMNQFGISNPENFSWCESVGLGIHGDEIKYGTKELEEAIKKAQEVVSQYIKPTDTTIQKYAILYQWMCENVRYDHEALDNGHVHTKQGKSVGQLGGTNGTVNGLVYGSCVCEGYSKSMQMLLKLCGIPSFDVCCIAEDTKNITPTINLDGKKKMHEGDHSILKVNIDGICYYSDITWDADRYQHDRQRQFFLLSTRDISSDHKLIGENHVFASPKSISNQEFQELMSFAQERIKIVNKELEEKKDMNKSQEEMLSEIEEKKKEIERKFSELHPTIVDGKKKNYAFYNGHFCFRIDDIPEEYKHLYSSIPNKNEPLYFETDNIRQTKFDDMDKFPDFASKYSEYEKLSQTEREIRYQIVQKENREKQKQIKHNNDIRRVEQLLDIRISPTKSIGYIDSNGQVHVSSKDTSELSIEEGKVKEKLGELYMNGTIDLHTRNELQLSVINQYNTMRKNAPKPVKPQSRDEATTTQRQKNNSDADDEALQEELIPMAADKRPIPQKSEPRKHIELKNAKDNHDYQKKEQKVVSDESNKNPFDDSSKDKKEKEELIKGRQKYRRVQFSQRTEQIGLGQKQVPNLNSVFQKQRQNQQVAQQHEEEHDHGMSM